MDGRSAKIEAVKDAIRLAINNHALITKLIGVSYPNGPLESGTCRDIELDLGVEESKLVYEAILGALNG